MKNQDALKFKALFGVGQELVPESIIVSPFFSIKLFSALLKDKQSFKGMMFSGVRGLYKNKEIMFIKTGVGATLVHDCVLALSEAKVSKIIFLGAVGAVSELDVGDCVLIKKAFFDKEYCSSLRISLIESNENSYGPDVSLVDLCEKISQKNNFKLKPADIMSLHSIWNENDELVLNLKDKRIDAVELECSIFYGITKFLKQSSLALCFVSDHLINSPFWSEKSLSNQSSIKKNMQDLSRLALDLLIF